MSRSVEQTGRPTTSRLLSVVAAVALFLPSSAWSAGKATLPRVAIVEIEPVAGVSAGSAKLLTNIVTARVGAMGRFEVISSTEVSAMLGLEKQKLLLGCTDSGCLSEIGGALGVDYLLSGQVGKIGSRFSLILSLADVRKARIVGRQSPLCEASEDVLVDTAQKAVAALFKPVLDAMEPAPIAPVVVNKVEVSQPSIVPPILTTALAAGALAAAIGCGVTAKNLYDGLAKEQGTAGFQTDWDRRQQGIRQRAMAADILYGTAAVAAGVSVWLWVRSASSTAPTVSVGASSNGAAVSVAGRF